MLFFGELLSTLMRVYGSVVPRCLMVSVLGAIEGVLLREYVIETSDGEQQSFWQHPYSLAIFGTVLGFSLVMCIQIAYQRYWEAATRLLVALRALTDAAVNTFALDEMSPDAFEDSGFAFRIHVLHLLSLMHAVAVIDMRQDDTLFPDDLLLPTLAAKDPYSVRLTFPPEREAPEPVEEEPPPSRSFVTTAP
jgi:predicted membrane chloride channel (bestrophin family)